MILILLITCYHHNYSHHLSAWYCIDIVRRNSILVTYGSLRVEKNGSEPDKRKTKWIFKNCFDFKFILCNNKVRLDYLILASTCPWWWVKVCIISINSHVQLICTGLISVYHPQTRHHQQKTLDRFVNRHTHWICFI